MAEKKKKALGDVAKDLYDQSVEGTRNYFRNFLGVKDPVTGQVISAKTGKVVPTGETVLPIAPGALPLGSGIKQRESQSTGGYKAEVDLEALNALQNALGINVPASMAQMQESVENLQDLRPTFAATVAPPQLDLTPAAALVDLWTGSKFANTYKPPERPEAGLARVLGLEKQIASQAEDVNKGGLEALRLGPFFQRQVPSTSKTIEYDVKAPPVMRAGSGAKALKNLTPGQLDKLSAAREGIQGLQGLITQSTAHPEMFGLTGSIASKVPGGVLDVAGSLGKAIGSTSLQKAAEKGADIQAFQARLMLVKQKLGRDLEGGVLRLEDEKKYDEIVGKIGSDPKKAQVWLGELNDLVQNALRTKLDTYGRGKYDVSGFTSGAGVPELGGTLNIQMPGPENKPLPKKPPPKTPAQKAEAGLSQKAMGEALLKEAKMNKQKALQNQLKGASK